MFIHKFSSQSLRFVLMAIASCALSLNAMWAQNVKVTGKVTDKAGEPLVGVYVLVQGTTNGSTTDVDGKYTINAPGTGTLVFSSMGFTDLIEPVNNRSVINVILSEDAVQLGDVVVTAMGIKKERKALGYAVQDIKSDEILKNKTANVLNSLSGKIAGVNITQASGAAGAGAQIIIRGGTSLQRDNQPLFVVDGVVYDNSTSVNGNSGFDGAQSVNSTYSNRLMDINPEDIENMSVLKGPAAAALYGSRAAAGVIVITTKKGQEGSVQVNFSSKFQRNWVNRLPERQSIYGRGYYNEDGELIQETSLSSWGAKIAANAQVYDNIKNFFETSNTWDNSVSVSGGNKNGSFYLSASNYSQDGIIPGTSYDKNAFRLNADQKYGKLKVSANVAYTKSDANKALTSAGLYNMGGTGAMNSVYRWPIEEDIKHWQNEDGSKYRMFEGQQQIADDVDNPYWIAYKNPSTDKTTRFTGSLNLNLDVTNWWNVAYTVGTDRYTTNTERRMYSGSGVALLYQNGFLSQNDRTYEYLNSNIMSTFHKTFGDFDFSLLVGQSIEDISTKYNGRLGYNFIVKDFFSFGNMSQDDITISSSKSRKRLIGVYSEFRASYKNIAYLTVTGRNDWTSTLPIDSRSYFYPSVSGSLVFTELLPKSSILSFGKIRASWAKVGKDADAYVTNTYVNSPEYSTIANNAIRNAWERGNPYLKPEQTKSWEIGVEMRFFNGRLGVDYTYYNNNSYNQLLSPRTSQATGYIFMTTNAGDITNKGMELSISGTPISKRDFSWDMTLNLSGNRGTVNNLLKGLDILYVTDVQVGNAKAASFNSGNFMAISGSKYARTEDGKIILDGDTGMPTYDGLTTHEIGNREPTLIGGLNNNLRYKNWNLSFLFDLRLGGDVYNGTDYFMTNIGMSKKSLNRESITLNGVIKTGEVGTGVLDDKGKEIMKDVYGDKSYTYKAGEQYVIKGKSYSGEYMIRNYYNTYSVYESSIYMTKVNWLRLRSVSLSYNFDSLLRNVKFIKGATATLTGTNLWLVTNYKGMDPETSAAGSGVTGSSSVGIDYCGVPATAGVSFGINLTF